MGARMKSTTVRSLMILAALAAFAGAIVGLSTVLTTMIWPESAAATGGTKPGVFRDSSPSNLSDDVSALRDRALELIGSEEPGRGDQVRDIASALVRHGSIQDGMDLLRFAIEHPENEVELVAALRQLGHYQVWYSREDPFAAEESLARALDMLKADPDVGDVYSTSGDLATLFRRQNRHEESVRLMDWLLTLDRSRFPEAQWESIYSSKASSQEQLGDLSGAAATMRQLREAYPNQWASDDVSNLMRLARLERGTAALQSTIDEIQALWSDPLRSSQRELLRLDLTDALGKALVTDTGSHDQRLGLVMEAIRRIDRHREAWIDEATEEWRTMDGNGTSDPDEIRSQRAKVAEEMRQLEIQYLYKLQSAHDFGGSPELSLFAEERLLSYATTPEQIENRLAAVEHARTRVEAAKGR
jgi:tetratricopeptide (TPR) repeat protein